MCLNGDLMLACVNFSMYASKARLPVCVCVCVCVNLTFLEIPTRSPLCFHRTYLDICSRIGLDAFSSCCKLWVDGASQAK